MTTLTEFLSIRPDVAFHGEASPKAHAAREMAVEHLTNIHRATTEDLDPEVLGLWRRETADDLDTLEMTASQQRELTELFDALEADPAEGWTQDVLSVLGLTAGLAPVEVERAALVSIHRTGSVPVGEPWLPMPNTMIAELMNAGLLAEDAHGVTRNSGLVLTDAGLSAAAVLVPRVSVLGPGERDATGQDVKALMISPATDDGSRTVVRFVLAGAAGH